MAITKRKKWMVIITGIAILSFIYVIGTPQNGNKPAANRHEKSTPAIEDKESVEGKLIDEDPWSEMNKIANRYINNSQLAIFGNIRLYEYETSKFLEEQPFSYSNAGTYSTYNLGSIETATNSEYSVAVDNSEKIISVSKVRSGASSKVFDLQKLKKLMLANGATAKVLQSDTQKIILVEDINYDDIVNYKVFYNPGTYQIKKIVLEMSTLYNLNDIDNDETPDSTTDNDGSENAVTNESDNKIEPQEIDTLTDNLASDLDTNDYVVEINYINEKHIQQSSDPVKKFMTVKNNTINVSDQFKNYELINQAQ